MAKETKVQRNYRLPADLVERIQSHASTQGISETEAATRLLSNALEAEYSVSSPAEREIDTVRILGDHIRDLRATVSTLTAQLVEKDNQIARLHDIAEHSQMLEAVHVGKALQGESSDGTYRHEAQEEEAQPRGIWAWLARKIEGK